MSIDYKIIGHRIKERRRHRGLTQEKLAERLSVSCGYISQIERGITRVNLDTLSCISTELDCDIAELLTETSPSGENFLKGEMAEIFNSLSDSQRRMLLKIASIIKNG